MRKMGASIVIAALAAAMSFPPPAAAFGLRLGPFHIGLPFFWHRYPRPLYMRVNPNDVAHPESMRGTASMQGTALLYPSLALPAISQNIFWPTYSTAWPFSYEDIFSTAFAGEAPNQDQQSCQQSGGANGIVGRIRTEIAPTADQTQLLQKLIGALTAASGYLANSCPAEIPARPVARLQLMESQLEQLAMAVDMIRQPLQDFTESLNDKQQMRFAAITAVPVGADRKSSRKSKISGCGGTLADIDWSLNQIDHTIQPTDAQRDALADVKEALTNAVKDLEIHCPTSTPSTALARLEAIEAHLDATWRAVLSIQVALADFETHLRDDQRDRLDAMSMAAL